MRQKRNRRRQRRVAHGAQRASGVDGIHPSSAERLNRNHGSSAYRRQSVETRKASNGAPA